MKYIFLYLSFLPLCLNATTGKIKENILFKTHQCMVDMKYISRFERDYIYKKGKMDAYFEIIELIELENGKKEKRNN